MPGLDPGLHEAFAKNRSYGLSALRFTIDRRVKPGDDDGVW
jgi:hypothetical protein